MIGPRRAPDSFVPSSAFPWIKVCGVRTRREVELCARAGATHVGLNSWPRSPRFVPPRDLRLLAEAAMAEGVLPVVVHVPGSLLDFALFERIARLYLQSPVRPAGGLRRRSASGVAVWIEARAARRGAVAALPQGDVLLVDAYSPGLPGGTGRRIDSGLLHDVPRPFVLAGGISPDSVAALICSAAPAGVDAASGLESSPGVKDPGKVRAYCQAAKEAFEKVRREPCDVRR